MKRIYTLLIASLLVLAAQAQTGGVRGFVYDKETGEPAIFATVALKEIGAANVTDLNGLFSITRVPPGTYTLYLNYLGYDSISMKVTVQADKITTQNLYLTKKSIELVEFSVSAEKQRKRTDPNVSQIQITQKELKQMPTFGGEPDLLQYLQVLPGVVFSGDQGGQLYIRGGSPVMNKVLLDGMTIYNPFHSIGLFSVFDADIIQNADVYTAGFGAQYGGRISAIIDITTREGNKTRLAGKVAVNPFVSKALLEGPLRKFKEGSGSSSFLVSYKNSYLQQSSKLLYQYADPDRLPYNFQDLYGKLSFNSSNGSKINLFGFDYEDQVNFPNTTNYSWSSKGLGGKFLLLPDGSRTIIDGFFAYSNYIMRQKEQDLKPRSSGISGFNAGLNFGYYIKKDEFKYGIELNGFRTDFQIYNSADRKIDQFENTTELSGWFKYKKVIGNRFIIEPSFRMMYYASLGEGSPEPRLALKYNINEKVRIKASGGFYSQNLLSANSDRDVVNLFYGFLSGPDDLPSTFRGNEVTSRLQKARHAVAGVEYDVTNTSDINFEVYIKDFTQLTNINRDKIFEDDINNQNRPELLRKDFIVEDGKAYGFDIRYKYEYKRFYFWAVYSFNIVTRRDEYQTYYPVFDRRHNINLVSNYTFGKDKSYEVSLRWNFGSGFPFTQTQNFYENNPFSGGVSTDYTTTNGDLGIQYASLNDGRLPYYHRLDFSAQKKWKTGKNSVFTLILSCTNVYNRENIFYFDRVKYIRVNQLPILPTIGGNWSF